VGQPGAFRRQPVSAASADWVEFSRLFPDRSLPLLVRPRIPGIDALAWGQANRELLERRLLEHGAILFRGFPLESVEQFERFIGVVSAGAVEYKYRASPRTQVSGNIYTSTDYPAEQTIFPHNEHAFSPVFPLRLFFYCVTPPGSGGQTPIGDGRRILARIPAAVREAFGRRGVLYQRNYNDGFGLPWQVVFQSEDKGAVEAYCREHEIALEWKPGERLRTRQVGPAVVRHPRTGEPVWFNHATFFHVSTLPPELRDGVLAAFGEDDLPTQTYYGDGAAIEPDVLEQLRAIYLDELVDFDWQPRDVLMVDNMLTVHGRRPYSGARKIVVGMAEPTRWKDVLL
jgi:alpha-ketoglutarate-dependent taurine dioxygenase